MHLKEDPHDNPITELQIVQGSNTSSISNISKWNKLNVNLNDGQSEETSLWLYYTKDTSISSNPVTSIIIKEGSSPIVSAEYKRIPVDLNSDVGGYHLFMFYSQDGMKDPITAITAKECFTSNCYLDGWERVEKDLNKGVIVGMSVYLFFKREKTREPVTDVVVILNDQTTPEGYTKVDVNLNSITFRGDSIHLWYKTSPKGAEATVQDLAIEFGQQPVTPFGWDKINVNLNSAKDGKEGFEIPSINRLKFDQDGSFKILQLADLHFTNEEGFCRDVSSEADCKGDATTIDYINKVLDKEKPSLVVFSGDNINGGGVSDARAATYKFAEPVIKRKIPWAVVFGEHDDGNDLSREELLQVMKRMPYSLIERGPMDVPGVGNYALKIYSNGTRAATHDFTLYFLDSHSRSEETNGERDDSIKKEQLDWIVQSNLEFQKLDSKPDAIIFFHAPIWEYDQSSPRLGDARESVSTPKSDTHSLAAFRKTNSIKVASCGRDHVNDYCLEQDKIQLCYAGGAGVGGYGAAHMGWPRRSRVFKLSENGRIITTWKRLDDKHLTMIDFQTLYVA
ncbi:hypothetical protein G6F61_007377 [Rhizopus arrhizus]|nr:hypothetical protein G6F61_007377 [Rhizopus arrhizus]